MHRVGWVVEERRGKIGHDIEDRKMSERFKLHTKMHTGISR